MNKWLGIASVILSFGALPMEAMRIGGIEMTEREKTNLLREDPGRMQLEKIQKGQRAFVRAIEVDARVYVDQFILLANRFLMEDFYLEEPDRALLDPVDQQFVAVQSEWNWSMNDEDRGNILRQERIAAQRGSLWAELTLRYRYDYALNHTKGLLSEPIQYLFDQFKHSLACENALMHRVIKGDKAVWQNRIEDTSIVKAPPIHYKGENAERMKETLILTPTDKEGCVHLRATWEDGA